MYVNMEIQSNRDYYGEYRGRGRGGRVYYRGRGRGGRLYWDSRDSIKVICFRCDKIGYFVVICFDRLFKL